jgi:UDPglucose 6-dehydrogenase
MKNILVVGAGHVGLVTAACLADLGNKVTSMDDDERKIDDLKRRTIPFYEPGLEEIVHRNMDKGRLFFTTSIEEGISASEIIFICVGTPQKESGEADISSIESVSQRIAETLNGYKVIVEKSTVPVKTGWWIKKVINSNSRQHFVFDVVCNPEFMREGNAIYDFLHPDRVVIGVETEKAAKIMISLYEPLDAPIVLTNIETAELTKHAANSFLALKISYINAIARLCDKVGADVRMIAEGMGYDRRIGRQFLDAGLGYGGYCFPKDVAAFIKIGEELGYDFELLKIVQKINKEQHDQAVEKLRKALWTLKGKVIGILGLSFKPDTDDIREAPSIYIVNRLLREGATVKAYDPQAMNNARTVLPDIEYCKDPYELAKGTDAILVVTEWDEFRNLELNKLKRLLRQPVIIDGRNIYNPVDLRSLGFVYEGIGRP